MYVRVPFLANGTMFLVLKGKYRKIRESYLLASLRKYQQLELD
jgi:hypothetical protein